MQLATLSKQLISRLSPRQILEPIDQVAPSDRSELARQLAPIERLSMSRATDLYLLHPTGHSRIMRSMFGRKVVMKERDFPLDAGQSVCTRLADEGIDADLVESMLDPRMVPLGAVIEGGRGREPRFHLAVARRDATRAHQLLGW